MEILFQRQMEMFSCSMYLGFKVNVSHKELPDGKQNNMSFFQYKDN